MVPNLPTSNFVKAIGYLFEKVAAEATLDLKKRFSGRAQRGQSRGSAVVPAC
jgi:hypothetical protein